MTSLVLEEGDTDQEPAQVCVILSSVLTGLERSIVISATSMAGNATGKSAR